MRTVRVPRKPVVLIAVNSHEMPAVVAGLDQSSPRPSLAGHLLTRMGGAGERFGPDYIWARGSAGRTARRGRSRRALGLSMRMRFTAISSITRHVPCPVKQEAGRRYDWVLRRTVRTGAAVGRHPTVHMPVQSFPAARGTAVPLGQSSRH